MSATARGIAYVPLEDLHPHPENPRGHKGDLKGSLRRFGYTVPVLRCERTDLIAAGHGRWKALTAMSEKGDPAPEGVRVLEDGRWAVPVVTGWASADDDELLAYVIADNRQTELGGWELPELAGILQELTEVDLGLTGTGYGPKDLEAMLRPERPTVARENSYDQRADLYRNKQVRSFVFDYPLADYEEVTEAVRELTRRHQVETPAELFIAMLREWEKGHPA